MTMTSNSAETIKSVGGNKEFCRKFREYHDDIVYIDKNIKRLTRQYNNEWVAVFHGKTVAHDKSHEEVEKAIVDKKLPLDQVVIRHLSNQKLVTLF
jgi:hypothetical protein